MDEPIVTTATEPTTPVQAAQTPTTAVSVDMEAINKAAEARAERAAQAAVKDMLKQQGLDDAAVKTMLDEWKAKQTTPEQIIKQRDEAIGTLQQQLDTERQEKTALAKGIPLATDDETTKSKVAACMTLAKSYVSADVPFEAALDKALQIISFAPAAPEKPETKPPMWGGAGTKPVGNSEIDAMRAEYATAQKNRDGARMSFLVRKAQEKNIPLF